MNKKEYMTALEHGLRFVDEKVKDELLDDIRMHFEQGLSMGRREGEIVEELGPIEEFIQEIEKNIPKSSQKKEPKKDSLPVRRLKIIGLVASIVIKKSSNDKVLVNMKKEGKLMERIPYILTSSHKQDLFEIRVDKLFEYESANTNIELVVEVPNRVKHIELSNASGDILIDSLILEQMKLSTASGDVTMKKCLLDELTIDNASGDVKLKDVIIKHLNVNTADSDIDISGYVDQITVATVSGHIQLDTPAVKVLKLSTVSGDADIVVSDDKVNAKVKFSSMSGHLHVRTKSFDQSFFESKKYEFGDLKAHMTVSTVSGDINIRT